MKALSIRQPWLHAILHYGKVTENRSWRTSYRGPLFLHAAKASAAKDDLVAVERIVRATGREVDASNFGMDFGALVALADVVDCVDRHDSPWFFGPYALVLANVRLLSRPVSFRGNLGLFEVPDHVVEEV